MRQLAITWSATGSAEFPYEASEQGRELRVRLNDFPAEPMYTLLVDGQELESFDDWPERWRRPDAPPRIVYDSGVAEAPDNPFGNNVLIIQPDGQARLDHRSWRDGHRAWEAAVTPGAIQQLLAHLEKARFPAGSARLFPAGATIRRLELERSGKKSQVQIAWHDAPKLPGYDEAFRLMDGIVAQITDGALVLAAGLSSEPLVSGARRVV